MNTFKAILKQEYLVNKRSLSNLILSVGMPIAFFLFFTSLWTNGDDMSKDMIALWNRQYMIQMTAFSSLSFAFFSLPYAFQEDKSGNRLKAIQHSPIPLWQYYISKISAILVYFLIAIVAVFLTGHFIKNVSMPWQDWLTAGLLLFVSASCFMPFGILFGYIKSAQTLSIISNIFYLSLAVLGGLWLPISSFPEVMRTLAKWTPTYHMNHLVTSYLNNDFSLQSLFVLLAYALIILLIALVIGNKLKEK